MSILVGKPFGIKFYRSGLLVAKREKRRDQTLGLIVAGKIKFGL